MQLNKIKLAGFKSFVDPTTITLPSKLVAIVGPNGCGKSNIIDAVIWVMGENSPKYLRGESLTDVIFNGSSSRKPVGQASVELIFDNSDGMIGGEYGKYNEISIKRLLNRDSDSVYYLNGARCRKRDVVDLFLGTGLGPRSYSIIGQNMINRIIEAKPDELRLYIEEAAGISKYKERRHETELRIQHTRENVSRINDLLAEVTKQLNHLKHQANVAEKFKTLKQQERIFRADLYALNWRILDAKLVEFTLQIQRAETGLEARNTELMTAEREIEQIRHEQRVAHDAHQEVQRRYYAISNEITRIEQDILHHGERKQQWENDLKQTENDWQVIKDQIDETEDDLRSLEQTSQQLEPVLAKSQQDLDHYQTEFAVAEEQMQGLQIQWEEFTQDIAKTSEAVQIHKMRLQHLEQKIADREKRHDQLHRDQSQFNFSALEQEIEHFAKKSYEAADQLEFHHQQVKKIRNEINALNLAQHDATINLDKVRHDLHGLKGQQTSLEALQQTALGQRDNPASAWLDKQHLQQNARLAQHIEVESGWELAVEKVLGNSLQAICVDQMTDVTDALHDFPSGNLSVFIPPKSQPNNNQAATTTLMSKVNAPWPLDYLLAGIYVAETLDEALAECKNLAPSESIITKDGIWLNPAWIKVMREQDSQAGILERERALKALYKLIGQTLPIQAELEKNITERREQIKQLEEQYDSIQQAYSQYQAKSAQLSMEQKLKQERLQENKSQYDRLIKDQEICLRELHEAQAEYEKISSEFQKLMSELEIQSKAKENLMAERNVSKQQLELVRNQFNQTKERIHELEIRLQATLSEKSALFQNISHLQIHLTALNERKITLQSELTSMPPIESLNKSLTRALDKHVNIEAELNNARVSVETLDQETRHLEEKRQIIERDRSKIRNILESLRVEWQGYKTKMDAIHEQIKQTEFRLEDILKSLPQDITQDEWQSKLDQVTQRINKLGPINLVAIEEYETCLERKQYLDKQLEDLKEGLATLEDAMNKIDRETRTRFKETFDQVNQSFQNLFPNVFGGGKAYLALTCDNLLEAGVTAMACPPGKRNSSIYLLSGGEKTLTAIALIFSIFQLNPAPFCLLDEVDAALDDANVMRFTDLVKSMTEKTQFVFISHNKATIEMAQHLIGVTMNEPGVSRLVSVDIEKAMTLAGV